VKKVLFVTSRVDDARELTYRALNVWSVTVPTDLAFAPALAATENFDFALFDIGLVGAWAPDLLRAVVAARAGFPVFILSREYALPFQTLAREAGAADYISIPYAFPSLKKRIDRVIDSSDGRALPGARSAHQAVLARESVPSYGQARKAAPAGNAAHEGKTATAQRPIAGAAGNAGAESHARAVSDSGAGSNADTVCGEGNWRDEVSGRPCIIGQSDAMAALRSRIQSIRDTTETVLITGETGSGKDLVARMIHEASPVSAGPFVPCNVSCIPESLAESALFGSCRGSYTGSTRDVKGLFEAANGGTLFLDEIGELSLALQPKLLRVLEEGSVSRIGSFERRPVRFRLICATHRDLADMVAARRFRTDLFYRLDVIRVESPPLRSHPEDIPALASRCLLRHRKVLSPRALEKLKGYPWPGNVRQLYACLLRAACAARGAVIDCDSIDF
jgi:two-component system response regulator PilR (NtrC family)